MKPAGQARVERRLAAILAADVAGYSRLIGADEEGTLARLKAYRREVIDPKIAEHRGRLVKTTGDGLLVEFASVVDALRCAVEVQRGMSERNATAPPDNRIEFRIGVNVGDIVVEDDDIFGDGVNIAARLEGIAEPGRICISARVQEDAAGRLDPGFEDIGEQALKNIARPVRVFRVATGNRLVPAPALPLPDKPSIAVLPFANLSGDPEQEYFADGMVEEIITALSRIRWLFVIARNSSFTYKDQADDVKQVGRELGVRYVLEGSVRKAGGRVRITAQLIDAPAAPIFGPTALTARSKTSSILRTKWHQASPGSSNPHCRLPRPRVRKTARRTILQLTISTFAPMRWSCRRHGKVSKRSVFWSRRSSAIPVTGPPWPGLPSAVFGCLGTVGAKIRRRTA